MPRLSREEQEIHIYQTGDNRDEFEVFADIPAWISRLDKIADRVEERGEGFVYKLTAKQVLLRKEPAPRKMSKKQLKALSDGRQKSLEARSSPKSSDTST